MSPVSPSCRGMSITSWWAARIALFTLRVDMGGKALCHQFLLPVGGCQ